MEDLRISREQKEMEPFVKLKQKLDKAKRYRENNEARLTALKASMKKARDHMDEVNKQHSLTANKVIITRKKT